MNAFIDLPEITKRIIKYLIEGIAVAFVASMVHRRSLSWDDIAILGLTAATTFSILDAFIPRAGDKVRKGVGFGLGLEIIGLPLIPLMPS